MSIYHTEESVLTPHDFEHKFAYQAHLIKNQRDLSLRLW